MRDRDREEEGSKGEEEREGWGWRWWGGGFVRDGVTVRLEVVCTNRESLESHRDGREGGGLNTVSLYIQSDRHSERQTREREKDGDV